MSHQTGWFGQRLGKFQWLSAVKSMVRTNSSPVQLEAKMPLNDERPASTSSSEEQGSDVESSSERCDSMTSTSDLDCSRESFTSDSSSKHCTPSCESAQKTIFILLTTQKAYSLLCLFTKFVPYLIPLSKSTKNLNPG